MNFIPFWKYTLIELSKGLEDKINSKEKKYYTPEEIIGEFKSRCSEIKLKYNLFDYHKFSEMNFIPFWKYTKNDLISWSIQNKFCSSLIFKLLLFFIQFKW